jgi:hypothetical protein
MPNPWGHCRLGKRFCVYRNAPLPRPLSRGVPSLFKEGARKDTGWQPISMGLIRVVLDQGGDCEGWLDWE